MYKFLIVPLLAGFLLLAAPTPVKAEGNCGVLCWLGFDGKFTERKQIGEDAATDRVRIEQEGEANRARIQAEADQRIADINAMADQRIAEAQVEVERVRQQQFENEAMRDIEVARVQAAASQFAATINAMRDQQIAAINGDVQKGLAALNGATEIGLKSIETSGQVKMWAITWDGVWSVVLVVGLVILGWYFLKKQAQPQVIQVLPGPDYRRLPPGYRAQLPQRGQHERQEIIQYEDYDDYQ